MVSLVSRRALLVAFCYSALVGFSLIVAMHVYDSEDAAVVQGLLGLPWDLVVPHQEQWLLYFFAVVLNMASVYIVVFGLLKSLTTHCS